MAKMFSNKVNENVFKVRLKHSLKKSTFRELQLTAKCVAEEIKRRSKK